MPNILKEICLKKQELVDIIKQKNPLDKMDMDLETRGFYKSIKNKIDNKKIALIAEAKKASPSKGLIRKEFYPIEIAKEYQRAGACCISVLTDEEYFMGCNQYLIDIRENISLPVLRKDFMVDPYQIYESRAIGADCVLLIMAALDEAKAKELENIAHELNMDVLIEIHDETDLEKALKLDSKLLGINNRNLKTMEIDINNTLKLSKLIPNDYSLICESGIYSNDDIKLMTSNDIYGFLVGESLMRQEDIYESTRSLIDVK